MSRTDLPVAGTQGQALDRNGEPRGVRPKDATVGLQFKRRFNRADWIEGPGDSEWGWGYVWGYRRAQREYMKRIEKAVYGRNFYYGVKKNSGPGNDPKNGKQSAMASDQPPTPSQPASSTQCDVGANEVKESGSPCPAKLGSACPARQKSKASLGQPSPTSPKPQPNLAGPKPPQPNLASSKGQSKSAKASKPPVSGSPAGQPKSAKGGGGLPKRKSAKK